jgi:hypothetical protein
MNARRALIVFIGLCFAFASFAAAGPPQTVPGEKIEAKPEAGQAAVTEPAAQPPAAAEAKPAAKKAEAKRTEPLFPAYQTPREKTAVIVFYVWLWLSIGVLLYFLRWWVQEADRVYRAKFYEPVESPRKDNPLPPFLGE